MKNPFQLAINNFFNSSSVYFPFAFFVCLLEQNRQAILTFLKK